MTARKMLLATFGLLAVLFASSAAEARPRPGGKIHGRRFEANKTFGLGLELGDLVGVTGKYFVESSQALDFGIGYNYYYGDRTGGLHLYGDYLWHPVSLASAEAFELPFYIGVGARFWDFGYDNTVDGHQTAYAFGARVPIGISFDFNEIPLDAFIQLTPTLDFFHNYAPHDVFIDFDFTIGVRYWFD
jgi:hypothetical protein